MQTQARSRRLLTASALLVLIACATRRASADEGGAAPTLPHAIAMGSVGVPLRITVNDKFAQNRAAPAFSDGLVGYVFGSKSTFSHGAGLGFSLNLHRDGGFTQPVRTFEQFVLMPAYLLHLSLRPDLVALGHVGIPLSFNAGTTAGFEVAMALGYRLLSGFGPYAEAGLDTFGGANSTLHLTASVELGLFIDYEVLP